MRTSPWTRTSTLKMLEKPNLLRLLQFTVTAKTRLTLQQRPAYHQTMPTIKTVRMARTDHTRGLMTSQMSGLPMRSTGMKKISMQMSTTAVRVQESADNLRVCSEDGVLLERGLVDETILRHKFYRHDLERKNYCPSEFQILLVLVCFYSVRLLLSVIYHRKCDVMQFKFPI